MLRGGLHDAADGPHQSVPAGRLIGELLPAGRRETVTTLSTSIGLKPKVVGVEEAIKTEQTYVVKIDNWFGKRWLAFRARRSALLVFARRS
jgi:hypothetical protein